MDFQFVSRGDVHARVTAVCALSVKAQAEIHLLACSIMEHTRAHGDYTAAEALLNGLPRGTRVKALAFWFKHYSNGKLTFKIDDATKQYVGKLDKQRDDSDFNIAGCIETSFADLTNEQAPVSVTVKSLLAGLKSKATNAEMHSDGITPKVTVEAREVASRILAFVKENKLDIAA